MISKLLFWRNKRKLLRSNHRGILEEKDKTEYAHLNSPKEKRARAIAKRNPYFLPYFKTPGKHKKIIGYLFGNRVMDDIKSIGNEKDR